MRTNWKRLTLEAIILASLTLLLFGCGGGSGTQAAPATKPVSGVVSSPATGLPLANATVTAYAVGANGVVAATPLSMPASVSSDAQGNYTLNIPAGYAGSVMVVATLPNGSQIRSVLPPVSASQTVIPPAMVSLATEMVAQFITQNNAGLFTAANLQVAIQVLEPFFGTNFAQIPAPANGTALTPLQQNLLTVTQAINALLNPAPGQTGYTLSQLVGIVNGTIYLGQGTALTDLQSAIATIAGTLINNGTIPGSYTQPTITPIPVPLPGTDTTPPAAPTNLTATATENAVTLTWDPAAAADGVTTYLIYRNGAFIAAVAASTVTFTDAGLAADTLFSYEIRARDAAANLSAASTPTSIRTTVVPTFTISGTITLNGGTPTAGMVVGISVTGAGFGIAFTDAAGNYTFTGARAGTYTITPSLQGFLFTPASRTVTITNANATGVDFATVTPPGAVIGGITYPPGTVIGGITYPVSVVIGGVTYPAGTVISFIAYPNATIIGGVSYPAGTVIGNLGFPNATIVGAISFPTGTVSGGVISPDGVLIGNVTYPTGSVTGTPVFPDGLTTISATITFPP